MQVVGEGPGEEFDAGPVERSSHPTVVPTHIEGHLTEGISDSQARGLIVDEGLESQPFGGHRCIGNHPVAPPIGPVGNGSQIDGLQFISSSGSSGQGGVAYGAHIGGFVFGAVVMFFFGNFLIPQKPFFKALNEKDGKKKNPWMQD